MLRPVSARFFITWGTRAQFVRNFAYSNKVFLKQKCPKTGHFIVDEVNFVLNKISKKTFLKINFSGRFCAF